MDRRGVSQSRGIPFAWQVHLQAFWSLVTWCAHAPLCRIKMRIYAPSLFDRLFGDATSLPVIRLLDLDELKETVARDLEVLLNTRRVPDFDDASVSEPLRRSVLGYGLLDFSSMSLSNVHDRLRVCAALKQAIEVHEPRLREVEVSLDAERREHKQLAFSINARLVARPTCEPVSFDALLQPATLQYSVFRQASRLQRP